MRRNWRQARRKAEREREDPELVEEEPTHRDWKEELLEALLAMSPEGFERLAQRLLREAGFINTTVTSRSGDGGIDGLGVYRLSLVSFPVYFQCSATAAASAPVSYGISAAR
jgi:restriction system protein